MFAAVGGVERSVVRPGVGDPGSAVRFKVGNALINVETVHRAVVHAVHRLDGAGYLRPVYGNIDHMRFPSLYFMYTAAVVENHRG